MTTFVVTDTGGWAALAGTDLPDSGVTAGTYGDATHVSQITVNAKGIVTNASNVATGGGGTAGLVQLFDQTLGVAAATIDTGAGGVASGHGSLYVVIYARSTNAVTTENLYVRFNNDSGANYDWALMLNSAGAIAAFSAAATNQMVLANIPGASETASHFGAFRVSVPSYDTTTAFKTGEGTGGTPGPTGIAQGLSSISWRSTAAISRIAILPQTGGNLAVGSRMTVYGTA